MSNAPLTELLAAGLQLWRKGEQLGFKAPRGKMQPELRDRLVAAKPHLLEELEEGCRYSLCSFAQQRLWFLEQLEGASPVYNVNGGLKIEGTLNTAVFRKSLQEVVQRHQAFRTAFRDEKGTPYQMIFDAINVELPVVDLTSYGDNAENELRNLMRAKSNEVFVLEQAPLIKTVLYKISEEQHVLFFMTHHIVFDGWSSGIVLRELSHFYESETKGIETSLQPLEVDYSDHVVQQRDWFEGAEASRQLEYWNKKLAGELPVLEMPADKLRPAMQSTRGEMMFKQLSGELITKLHERARKENVSLFMLLLAASNVLLARYTNQEDILLGMPVANRKNKDLENIVGFFANTLVLRNDITGNPTFSELLQRTRETTLQALNHEDTPFEQIVESLRPERDLSRTPIFQAMISYEEDHLSNDFFGDLQTTALHVESQISRTDLTFWFYHGEGYLNVKLEYCIDLFDRESVQRWMQSFETLLTAIAADPSISISDLPVMPAQEEKLLLTDWNDTSVSYEKNASLPRLFEATAAANPEQIAAVFASEEMTYDALNHQSNRLAHYLIKSGVKAGDKVGLCMDRSLDMLIGLFGIMKTGAAYVPMDPGFPEDRLAYMCEDGGVELLLSESAQNDLLSDFSGTRIVYDDIPEALAAESDANPDIAIDPASLIYVIYTSGSTGKPKGVALPHGAVVNFLNSMGETPGLQASDRLLAVTTLSFDIAVLELYLPLIKGARVVIASRDDASDDVKLKDLIANEQINVMQATPVSWQMLLDGNWTPPSGFKALCGGEALPQSLCDALLAKGIELWNMYGPTETCVWSCVEQMHPEQEKILIGRPIANTTIYILDKQMKPVPIGVAGELYIGGDGLAAGYLNRDELTSKVFVPNPFAANSRLYKTGDLARYHADGRLECLGRTDFQVKIRGYRIELGEIESALAEQPSVEQAVVLVREMTPGDKRLVAYVGINYDYPFRVGKVRKKLRGLLPEYMVPSAYVQLEEFPLTPNGKIDRKALPMPDNWRSDNTSAVVEPSTDMEKKIAEIWKELLKVNTVSVQDNFFDIGGHSLLSVKMLSLLEETVGFRLALRHVLVQSLGQLAYLCEQKLGIKATNEMTT